MDSKGDREVRRSILVTGAASGIGLATARLFASRGWFVGGFDVNEAALEALSAELGAGAGVFRRPRRDRPTGAPRRHCRVRQGRR